MLNVSGAFQRKNRHPQNHINLDYLKFPSINPTVTFPCREYPTENSHLLRYPFTSGDGSIPSKLHGRPPTQVILEGKKKNFEPQNLHTAVK